MFDFITLTLLWIFTAGTSIGTYLLGVWPGGIWWFWFWNTVTGAVLIYELIIYLKYKMTLTRLLTKSGTDKPNVVKHKWAARLIVLSYLLGAVSLCVHLWPW